MKKNNSNTLLSAPRTYTTENPIPRYLSYRGAQLQQIGTRSYQEDSFAFVNISDAREKDPFPQGIVVIGEEVFSRSLAYAVNALPETGRYGQKAFAFWPDPDEGIAEQDLIHVMRSADTVIADPLYQVVQKPGAPEHFVRFPHEAYSGRIFRDQIPVFAGKEYQVCSLLSGR